MRRLSILLGLSVALLAAALLAVACGGQGTVAPAPETVVGTLPEATGEEVEVPEGDAAAGAEVWNSAGCGSCHTLEAAGSSGTVGPNLDEAQPSPEKTFVQVRDGGAAMPPFGDQLTEQQIADVTAYVVESTSG